MDRVTVQFGQNPLDTDILNSNRYPMIGLGVALQAILGPGPYVDGLPCVPGTGLTVNIGAGSIYALAAIDATPYGSLPADTVDQIVQQGITFGQTPLAVPAPTTAGQSINYLIEAQFQQVDSQPVQLLYYNSANPLQPLQGTATNTKRGGVCALQVKAGTPATTGSQTTPAADAGWTGLYVVTVAYGASSVSAGNIAVATGAPFIANKLPNAAGLSAANTFTGLNTFTQPVVVPAATAPGHAIEAGQVQSNATTYGSDTGTANVYQVTYTPAITALVDGMILEFEAANPNSGISTFTPNPGVIPPHPLIGGAHQPLQGGEVNTGKSEVVWHAPLTSWVLLESTGGNIQTPTATQPLHAPNLAQTQSLIAQIALGTNAPIYVNSPQTLHSGVFLVDTSAGGFALQLPTSPTKGQALTFMDASSTWGVNTWTLAHNGSTIMGQSADLTVNLADQEFTIWFNGSDWRLV